MSDPQTEVEGLGLSQVGSLADQSVELLGLLQHISSLVSFPAV